MGGQKMSDYKFNEDQIECFVKNFDKVYSSFLGFGGLVFCDKDMNTRLKKCFFASALCHNINWEYLCNNVISPYYDVTNGFEPSIIRKNGICIFESYFKDYPKKHKIESEVRFSMLSILTDYLSLNLDIFNKILACKTLAGINGLNTLVNSLPVFSDDPLHKKGNLFIQILLREGFVSVVDEENMEPAVDYHVIRAYLRFPFIDVINSDIKKRLSNSEKFELEEITELRTHISDCMKYVARKSGLSVAKLCFLAWSIGRNYCGTDEVLCEGSDSCPVYGICMGRNNPDIRNLKEPISDHGFY
jgi:hypothetical protein